jgi:hypothetical protein
MMSPKVSVEGTLPAGDDQYSSLLIERAGMTLL